MGHWGGDAQLTVTVLGPEPGLSLRERLCNQHVVGDWEVTHRKGETECDKAEGSLG